MYNYYCKNCNNIIGKWNNAYEFYYIFPYCNDIQLKNIDSIYFLDCKNCNKFIGIGCFPVCKTCFGEDLIFGEENLFEWFLKYKKRMPKYFDNCKICNDTNFRTQFWFFKELTFHK